MNASPAFDQALDEALDLLAAGQPADAILARYAAPAYPASFAPALAPLLQAAALAQAGLAGAPIPPPNLARGRRRFLQEALLAAPRRPAPRLRPAFAFALVMVVFGLAALVPWASAAALPGEALYPLKRAAEAIELALTTAPAQRQRLADNLAARRREEAARLLALRREAALAFEGTVQATQPDRLVISGLTVLTPDARAFAPGDLLAVEARTTRQGTLVATRLTRLRAAPVIDPARTITPTEPRPSLTPRPTRPAPTRVPPRPSATRRAPATRVMRPTARPSASRPAATLTQRPPTLTPPAAERPADPPATPTVRPVEERPGGTPSATPSGRP